LLRSVQGPVLWAVFKSRVPAVCCQRGGCGRRAECANSAGRVRCAVCCVQAEVLTSVPLVLLTVPRSLCRFVSQLCRKLTRLGALLLAEPAAVPAVLLELLAVEPLPRSLTSCEKAPSSRCSARSRCRDCWPPWASVLGLVPELAAATALVAAVGVAAVLVALVAVAWGPVSILLLGPTELSSWTSCWSKPARPPLKAVLLEEVLPVAAPVPELALSG